MRTKSSSVVVLLLFALVLLVSLGRSNAQTADADFGRQAFDIFKQRCFKCHGEFGSHKDRLFMEDRDALLNPARKIVVPGKPAESKLFKRITNPDFPMPPKPKIPLNAEEIAVIRSWIEGDAPNWKATPPERAFISTHVLLTTIEDDLQALDERDRPFTRYFTITHLYNASVPDHEMEAYRVALSKLINSLSWDRIITTPKSIDPEKTIYRIDLRDYEWDQDTWEKILAAYPYANKRTAGTAAQIYRLTNCEFPHVRADWFVARAALPPLYHDILELPKSLSELEKRLEVDVAKNIHEERRVTRAGFNNSGVSKNNRIVERHRSRYGAYWRSYDFSANVGSQNIFQNPLIFEQAGGEVIWNLPNGLQAYLLVNATGERLDEAPVDIVFNKDNLTDPLIRNGLSCIGCHSQGMKTFTDQVRPVVQQSATSRYDRRKALALYVQQETMAAFVVDDKERFAEAVAETGGEIGTNEPIVALAEQFEGPLDLKQAAAETGLTGQAFAEQLRDAVGLKDAGLGVVLVPHGLIKRDAWEEQFGSVVSEMQLGEWDLLSKEASRLSQEGKYDRGVIVSRKALEVANKNDDPDHTDVGWSLNNLGLLYKVQGKYTLAEPLYKRALEIYEKALGPDHPHVAISLNNLAELYRTQGKYALAEPLFKRALAIDEKALGPDHPSVGTSLNNLGKLYSDQGKYSLAEPLYKRALAIDEKALGPDHPDVAIDLGNLAGLYYDQAKYALAEPLYNRALAIHEKALGPDHPHVATSLNNLGLLYKTQGKYEEAEPLYKRSLAIKEKAFGPDHPSVATSLENLAALYRATQRDSEAEKLEQRAARIRAIKR